MVQLSDRDADNARQLTKGISSGQFREYIAVSGHRNTKPTSPTNQVSGETDNKPVPNIDSRTKRMHLKATGLADSIVSTATAMVMQETDIQQQTDTEEEMGSGPEGRVYYPLVLGKPLLYLILQFTNAFVLRIAHALFLHDSA